MLWLSLCVGVHVMFVRGLVLRLMVMYMMGGSLAPMVDGLGSSGFGLSMSSSGLSSGWLPHAWRHVLMRALHAPSGSCLSLLNEQFEMSSCLGYCASLPYALLSSL